MARFSFLVSALVAVALAGTVLAAAILVGLVPTGPTGVANASPPPSGLNTPGPSVLGSPLASASLAPVQTPSAPPTVQPSPGGTYTVQAGDSLFIIGQKFGVPWQLIAQANNIAGPSYVIQVGQVLTIPIPPQPTAGANSYIVEAGDNITKIAQKFGVDPTDLADFNNIADWNSIQVGQLLYIPGPGWTPLPTPSD